MEFQEVAKAYVRMCESYSTCEGCPIQAPGNDFDTCRCAVLKWPSKYESKIMAWAAEHPEPVYQLWGEWFEEHGDLIRGWHNATNVQWMAHTFSRLLCTPIPADIAEKLGIEPKGEA